ncbi:MULTISPECIES: helix-turn-helix domain-containing protein [unclassified Curtobacterium]|uniref:helix-turn-helix domain-containing protein n=1 Tax=unclassified Curtobacterium TaxID=257496 RepID=UPI00052AC8E8|nr:MerR family transcriptional regulator [Curtobacterium sp. MR_MD2014]AIV40093.1 MerR family transcriptional regulator [Curtobacterium sp. MR_MD2014]
MHAFPVPPRHVPIGDAAAFVGTTPRAIRHYHQLGLLPEQERGSDGRRRYGPADITRLLWIRRMAEAGVALEDVRDAFDGAAPSTLDDDGTVADVLGRLEDRLAEQEAELRRKRAAVRRMRARGSRLGLLHDIVAHRLEDAPDGSLRSDDLDTLLVTERILGPLGAFAQAGRFVALARDPALRAASDRVDAAEEALDDSVAVDDPRVAQVAAERHAFESALMRAVEESGQLQEDEAVFDAWNRQDPGDVDTPTAAGGRGTGAAAVIARMPWDLSPARLRAAELALQLAFPSDDA